MARYRPRCCCCLPPPCPQLIPAPTGLRVTSRPSPTSVVVAWDPVAAADGYDYSIAARTQPGQSGHTDQTTATFAGLAAGTLYTVTVRGTQGTCIGQAAQLLVQTPCIPTITRVNPPSGPPAGGNTVVVTGSCFVPDPPCPSSYGRVAATFASYTAVPAPTGPFSSYRALAEWQAGPPCAATYAQIAAAHDHYQDLPDWFASYADLKNGDQTVAHNTTIKVGDNTVADGDYTVDSATQITITAMPAGTGTVDVVATTTAGSSATGDQTKYAYTDQPAISGLDPDNGPESGGNQVVITGNNFTGVTAVKVGASSVPTLDYTVDSATQITIKKMPAGTGQQGVTVTASGGTSDAFTYTYNPAPAITALDPDAGPKAGGNQVVVTGTGFVTDS